MIVNDIVANLQFPLIKEYQVTEKQSSTQCQWKDKVNKHLWIIQQQQQQVYSVLPFCTGVTD